MSQPTTQDLIKKYVELRDTVEVKKDAHKKELKPYAEAMTAIEGALMLEMQRIEADSIKTSEGTAFKKRTMTVKTADKGALFDWVLERPDVRMEMLTAAVSKDVLKTYLEESGLNPPGVDVAWIVEVQVRRPQ